MNEQPTSNAGPNVDSRGSWMPLIVIILAQILMVSFISNDLLRQTLDRTTATPEQVTEAVRLNTEARLLALKVSIFALAGLALLAYFPAGALPGRVRLETAGEPARA